MRLKLVAVAVVALAPVVAMLVFNEISMRWQRNEEIRANAAQTARLASSEVERIVEGLHSMLIAVASMPSVQELDVAACTQALRSVASNVANIRTIFVIDLTGNPVCGSVDPPAGVNFADRDYFKQALESKGFVVGTYTESRMSKAAVLPVAMPLSKDGIIEGVVVTGVRLEWLQDRIAERGVDGGNAITIADANGTILARVPFADRFVGTVIPDAFQRLVHASSPGVMEVKSQDGTERILGYRPIDLPRNPLYISAGFSKEQAFAPINQATLVNTLSIIGGALLAFVAAVLIGNRFIVKPIHHIAQVMEDWKDGDTTARTGMDSKKGELGMVGATLDRLLDELDIRRRQTEEAEDARNLLSRELAHRVKNGFALVQAIARQSFHRSDPARYAAFSERLTALAGAYDLLLTRNAEAAGMMDTIVNALRAHHEVDATLFELEGPDLALPADVTLSLSLVIHELCTNATKYGSLSVDGGKISVGWTLDGERVLLRWQESGGPEVVVPGAKGFGTALVARAFASKYQARSRFDFERSGLLFELAFSLPRDGTSEEGNS
jgi:two-component sensor histidine kinase